MSISTIVTRTLLVGTLTLASLVSFTATTYANDTENNSTSSTTGSTSSGTTPAITIVVVHRDADIIDRLVAMNADDKAANEFVANLESAYPDPSTYADVELSKEEKLCDAVLHENKDAVATLLNDHANPNTPAKEFGPNGSPMSAMLLLAYYFTDGIATLLLANGGNKNVTDPDTKETILTIARKRLENGGGQSVRNAIAFFETNGFPE